MKCKEKDVKYLLKHGQIKLFFLKKNLDTLFDSLLQYILSNVNVDAIIRHQLQPKS